MTNEEKLLAIEYLIDSCEAQLRDLNNERNKIIFELRKENCHE